MGLHGPVVIAMGCFSEPAALRARQGLSLSMAQLLTMAMAWCLWGCAEIVQNVVSHLELEHVGSVGQFKKSEKQFPALFQAQDNFPLHPASSVPTSMPSLTLRMGISPLPQGCPGRSPCGDPFLHVMCFAHVHPTCPAGLGTGECAMAAQRQQDVTTTLGLHVPQTSLPWGHTIGDRCSAGRYGVLCQHPQAHVTSLRRELIRCRGKGAVSLRGCPVPRYFPALCPGRRGFLARQPGETSGAFLEKLPTSWLVQCQDNRDPCP